MLNQLTRICLWIAFGVTVAVILVNALYMVASPRAWFSLPRWLGLQGALRADRYGSGWAGLRIRALGAIIVVTLAWIGYDLLFSQQ